MKEEKLISIAMATYNGSKYLEQQLDSIYAQSYKNIEVVVTDDNSSDETIDILEKYRITHGLKYFKNKKNLGFVKNFEKAVSLCQGDYIALSDQDDIWLPHKLETLLEKIKTYSLAFSDAKIIDGNNHVLINSLFDYTKKPKDEKITFSTLLVHTRVQGCTALMKKNIIEKAHPLPKDIPSHDWWYALIAIIKDGIYFHEEPLVLYRQHDDNHVGAIKKTTQSLKSRLMQMTHKNYLRKRRKDANVKIDRLMLYKSSNRFGDSENKVIDELLYFYRSWGKGLFHFKPFLIAIKYRDDIFYFLPKRSRLYHCLRYLFL